MIAGTLCGLAGALLANHTDFVSPAMMHWTRSGDLIVMVVLGGMGSVAGPLLGAIAFLVLEELLPILMTLAARPLIGTAACRPENLGRLCSDRVLRSCVARGGIDGILARLRVVKRRQSRIEQAVRRVTASARSRSTCRPSAARHHRTERLRQDVTES